MVRTAILVADIQRTLGAAVQQYLMDEEGVYNVSIANNNNGANIAVTMTIARATGNTDPKTIQIPPYVAQTFLGVVMKALLLSGNGANVTVIVTDGNEIIQVQPSIVAVVSGTQSSTPISAVKKQTYVAVFERTTRPYALSQALVANSRNVYAALWHTATSTKRIIVRHVFVALESSSVAALVVAELRTLNGVPAGGTAVTPRNLQRPEGVGGSPSAEASAVFLPTSFSDQVTLALHEWNLGITGAASVLNPPPPLTFVDLMALAPGSTERDLEGANVILAAGALQGVSVLIDVNAATTVNLFVVIIFTEE